MFVEERQENILAVLKRCGKVKVKELSIQFAVTEDCIRKDLAGLEKKGELKRVYGGAVPMRENLHRTAVRSRKNVDVAAKKQIAEKAAALVQAGDLVFLDISTINLELARLLIASGKDITIVTNMIEILVLLAQKSALPVIFLGGELNKSRDGFWGAMTIESTTKFKQDIAFLGAVGMNAEENSVATYDVEDGLHKAAVLKASRKTYLVAQADKFNNDGNYQYASLAAFTGVITEQVLSPKLQQTLDSYGAETL